MILFGTISFGSMSRKDQVKAKLPAYLMEQIPGLVAKCDCCVGTLSPRSPYVSDGHFTFAYIGTRAELLRKVRALDANLVTPKTKQQSMRWYGQATTKEEALTQTDNRIAPHYKDYSHNVKWKEQVILLANSHFK